MKQGNTLRTSSGQVRKDWDCKKKGGKRREVIGILWPKELEALQLKGKLWHNSCWYISDCTGHANFALTIFSERFRIIRTLALPLT